MPNARVNGVDLHFERHGDEGDPLVLVHGFTGDITDCTTRCRSSPRTTGS